ncbi:MAG: hypothetical protein Tsb002_33440 [Wenzhouxiangellaceae bacterium]
MSKQIFTTAEAQDRTLSLMAVTILALGGAMLVSAAAHLGFAGQVWTWLEKGLAVTAILFALLSMVPWLRSRGQTCGPEIEGFLSDVAKHSLNISWFVSLAFAFLVLGRFQLDVPAAFYKDLVIGVMLSSYAISFLVTNWQQGNVAADGA